MSSRQAGLARRFARSAPLRVLPVVVAGVLVGCSGAGGAGSSFPKPGGKTIFGLERSLQGHAAVALATSVLIPGSGRLAYGIIGGNNAFVYGESAIYIATSRTGPVQGPFVARLDSTSVQRRFASATVINDPAAIKAVYETQVPFPRAGVYGILAMVRVGKRLVGGLTQTLVRTRSPIPAIGQRPPRVHTPTLASVHGAVAQIDTRVPPDDMHAVDFATVLGRRPVALLFSTPQLCQSRACGPVTDMAVQLESQYRGKIVFIHNEVYRNNRVEDGLRPQLRAFGLQTEPWLFTFDRRGRVAARLEGAFGYEAFREAIDAALRR
jgi:hypothetical protein